MGTQAARKNALKQTRASPERTVWVWGVKWQDSPRPRRRTIESFYALWLRARHQRLRWR